MSKLISHLKKFVDGDDRSVDWGKRAESLIDDLDDLDDFDDFDDLLDSFHDDLAFYRPGGGDHLLDEIDMIARCKTVLKRYSVRQ